MWKMPDHVAPASLARCFGSVDFSIQHSAFSIDGAPMNERLQKILSTAGIASRRAAEEYIRQGRVSVNGHTVTELGTKADADDDDIRVDGRRLKPPSKRRYILLYKPRGYITSRSDPEKRPTVNDL